ncbi:hypothetical protein O181_021265 [Austropuccinia psidii MF-1]|uniref:Uncharacterized protein n=1 Tax=Austropuccinia psidii MF-1 TaxID=1389203 RepID=A0A9Q3CEB7_9BASI|nr:hypothetical protein [Austropuccinia psidii MF-1]
MFYFQNLPSGNPSLWVALVLLPQFIAHPGFGTPGWELLCAETEGHGIFDMQTLPSASDTPLPWTSDVGNRDFRPYFHGRSSTEPSIKYFTYNPEGNNAMDTSDLLSFPIENVAGSQLFNINANQLHEITPIPDQSLPNNAPQSDFRLQVTDQSINNFSMVENNVASSSNQRQYQSSIIQGHGARMNFLRQFQGIIANYLPILLAKRPPNSLNVDQARSSDVMAQNEAFILSDFGSSKKPTEKYFHSLDRKDELLSYLGAILPPYPLSVDQASSSDVMAKNEALLFSYVGNGKGPSKTYFLSLGGVEPLRDTTYLQSNKKSDSLKVLKLEHWSKEEVWKWIKERKGLLPNPIWPNPTSLAVSSNDVVIMRPFRIWYPKARSKLHEKFEGTSKDDLKEIEQIVRNFHDAISQKPNYMKQDFMHCETLPIGCKYHNGFYQLKLLLPTTNQEARTLEKNLKRLLTNLIIFHEMALECSEFSPVEKNELKVKFWEWIRQQLFQPPNSLAITGTRADSNLKFEAKEFGIAQKFFIFVLTAQTNYNVLDGTSISLLSVWLKTEGKKLWEKTFKSDDGFFEALMELVYMKSEKNSISMEFWI